MERNMLSICFPFAIQIHLSSFTQISYILFHLMLQDKCLRCVSLVCYLLSSKCDEEIRGNLFSFSIFMKNTCRWEGKTLQKRAFPSRTHVTTFPIGRFSSPGFPVDSLTNRSPPANENVMNENVVYVMPSYTILLFSISKFHSVFI